jgi:hypothetical protein
MVAEATLMALSTSASIQVEPFWIKGGHLNATRYFELFVKVGLYRADSKVKCNTRYSMNKCGMLWAHQE